jgi:hypothetical protein
MSYALESFARQSLTQFMAIYSEVMAEHDAGIDALTLERLMWAKITGGTTKTSNKVPWTLAKKIKIQLPYLPHIINYTGCVGLKKCDGLYVPCGGKCVEDGVLCVTCEKHGAKYGVLDDRGEPGNYTDPTDKRETTYGTWLQKHEKTIEDVNAAIEEAGFTFEIPPSYLAVNAKRVVKQKPGRPKSKMEVSEDSDSESADEAPKKLPPVKKTKSESEDEPLLKPKKSKKADSSEDEEPKKLPPMKAESKSSDDEEKTKKRAPKKVKEETKEESKDDEDKPKKRAPKKVKEESKEDDESEEKPKKKATKKPETKKKTARKEEVEETGMFPSLGAEVFEPEEDEQVVVDGVEYTLRGKTLFDEDGMFVGTMVDGVPVFRETPR